MDNGGKILEAISIGFIVACFLLNTSRVLKAIELCKECLFILKSKEVTKDGKLLESFYKKIYLKIVSAYYFLSDYTNAIKYARELLHIHRDCGEKHEECQLSTMLVKMYLRQSKYLEAKEFCEKALLISNDIGDQNAEAFCYGHLGIIYQSVGEFKKARKHYEKSLAIIKKIGNRNEEATCYKNLASVCRLVGEYEKAKEHSEKALTIDIEISDRNGEAFCYLNLGIVNKTFGKYEKAREHLEKSLAILQEIGERNEVQASCYGNLGIVYRSVGEYEKAREHHEKSLAIRKEIGDRKGEAGCYGNLGIVYQSVSEYGKAIKHHEKALAILKEIGDRLGEASSHGNLGSAHGSVGEYEKARENLEKSLAINREIGYRNGEAYCYLNLGAVYHSVGKYEKAREHLEEALAIYKEIGGRKGEADCFRNLGHFYKSVGKYKQARRDYEKSLQIEREIGDRHGAATSYQSLGSVLYLLGKFGEAIQYYENGLVISIEIGARRFESDFYGSVGTVFVSIGDYIKAKEYLEKAIAIKKEIGDRGGEAACYLNLGTMFLNLGKYLKAEEYIKNALKISEKNGHIETHFQSLCKLADVKIQKWSIGEAFSYLLQGIRKCEDLRGSLRDNDHLKIYFSDFHIQSYRVASSLFCDAGNPTHALYVLELGRASALADLLSAQYLVKKQISANPQTWNGIENVMVNERNCTCLYVSYFFNCIFLWIVKASGVTHFRKVYGHELIGQKGMAGNLDDLFASKGFRGLGIFPEELCEDRSLDRIQPESQSCEENSLDEGLRIGKKSKENQGPKMNLPLCYKLIIAPVADLLDGSEIIIVPDRALYNIPFAALPDENGKYLSETFRIRVVPSLTTLKLIHDSPADYHSQTGALIVGNPDVGEVHLHGCLLNISRLPCAENEARMVAKKLGVMPLLGQQATKQAVLEVINSVSLIHFAAHGDAERGEIALAPAVRIPNMIPQEEHYLLTMSDISKAQLRAKLVVLSCCHSARGKIKVEGVVGIARAFLGSGARSVLVAQWAVNDSATEQFMSHFYEHLVGGDSASESLHEAMKWMRCNGYSDVKQWAPFMLIGDNVTFDFGK